MRYVLIMVLALWSATARGAVPQLVNYQGYLTDPAGNPLDTTVAMTFTLYDDQASGTQLWTETQPSCTVRAGLFAVRLGSVTAIPDVFSPSEMWLAVTVGNNAEMTPRTRLVSVAYSYRVGTVDGASGGTINGKLNMGSGNANTGDFAMVSGVNNQASGYRAVVSGGQDNIADGAWATVAGGTANTAGAGSASVGGGSNNTANGYYATVGGGYENVASDSFAAVTGGWHNTANGPATTISGGEYNMADSIGATIGGGRDNQALADYSTVGGGQANHAMGVHSIVAGGISNQATGSYSSVCGGWANQASGDRAFTGGGRDNVSSGYASAISGGSGNTAAGNYSFAAGRRAKAYQAGCFRWADSYNGDFFDAGFDSANSFAVRASGGVWFFTNTALSSGVKIAAGGNSWTSVSDSTKKRNIRPVDTKSVLERVRALPIRQWSYKSQDPSIEHIGPMAQDFWNAFQLGEDSLGISTIDPAGVALGAIQELAKRNETLEAEIALLRAQMQELMADRQQTMNVK